MLTLSQYFPQLTIANSTQLSLDSMAATMGALGASLPEILEAEKELTRIQNIAKDSK